MKKTRCLWLLIVALALACAVLLKGGQFQERREFVEALKAQQEVLQEEVSRQQETLDQQEAELAEKRTEAEEALREYEKWLRQDEKISPYLY